MYSSSLQHLVRMYEQPHRHYHNLTHIERMFNDLFNICESGITYIQYNAVWYHDVIYYTNNNSNELDSAALFQSKSHLDKASTDKICSIILATAKHTEDQDVDYETQCVLDADLADMGKTYEIYNRNAKNIRLEYSSVNYKKYLAGRIEFLNRMLNRKTIFYTLQARTLHEDNARNNILEELDQYKNLSV